MNAVGVFALRCEPGGAWAANPLARGPRTRCVGREPDGALRCEPGAWAANPLARCAANPLAFLG
ncbi:MAG TPA: hypothetical protein VLB87_03530 [Pyrinomonadaceae bacterium]|nr:hypothetical protein [Pyrinomonadaceae bacterium]